MREYIQRWSIIKNSAEQVSDERAIDAFVNGIRRQDLVEEIGRIAPTTIGQLMDTANKWANGEDAIHTKRNRSPEEDRYRSSYSQHRRYREYDGPGQVSAGFRSNNNGRDDYRGDGYRNNNRDAPGSSKSNNRPRPPRDFNMSPDELLNGPCQMHYYIDSEGRRQSNHLLKDCRT